MDYIPNAEKQVVRIVNGTLAEVSGTGMVKLLEDLVLKSCFSCSSIDMQSSIFSTKLSKI